MEQVKVVHIDKLGRNVFFSDDGSTKYVIMNNPKDMKDPTPLYPTTVAGYNDTSSNKMFYDYLTNEWHWGNVDYYYGGILYETDQHGNIIEPVVNQIIKKNGYYLAKPQYSKDVMVQHRFDINIPIVEKTVNLEEFGSFVIKDDNGASLSQVTVNNVPKLVFSGIRIVRWLEKNKNSVDWSLDTFFTADYATISTPSPDYLTVVISPENDTVTFHKFGTGSTNIPIPVGSKYKSFDLAQDNYTNMEFDVLFDNIYHEYDPVLGWVVKTLKFIGMSWIQTNIITPFASIAWDFVLPRQHDIFYIGNLVLDVIIDNIDSGLQAVLPTLGN